jgi:hypothetical protein
MDGVASSGGPARALPVAGEVGAVCHRDGVRRLFELPVERAEDCGVRIRAGSPGRCAVCNARYPAGEWIGHSRESDGWVASCCS